MGNCNARSKSYGSTQVELEDNSTEVYNTIVHEGPILGMTYLEGGDKVLTCSDDNRIAITNVNSLHKTQLYTPDYLTGHSKAVSKVISSNNNVWSCSRDLCVKLWDTNTELCSLNIPAAHELNIVGLAASHFDPSTVYSGSRDYSVKAWDTESGVCKTAYSLPRNIVTTLQSSPNNPNLLYQGAEDLNVRVWDVRTPSSSAPVQVISGYVYFPVSMDIHPEGQLLATGCKGFDSVGCTVKVWDLRKTLQPVAEFAGHSQDVVGCKFSLDEPDIIVSTSKDGSIRSWAINSELDEDQYKVACYPHTGKLLSCLAVSSSGGKAGKSTMVLGANDGSISFASMSQKENSGKRLIIINGSTKPYFLQDE